MQTVGERISYLRRIRGIKKKEMTNDLGISNIGRIERGERTPGIDIIISISSYFNVSTDWLLTGNVFDEIDSEYDGEEIGWLQKINKLSGEEKTYIGDIIDALIIARQLRENTHTTEDEIYDN